MMDRELNNAALYGESVFASFRVNNSGIFQWEQHKERLLKGICYLFFRRDVVEEDYPYFEKLLTLFFQELDVLNRSESFYARVTFYRNAYAFAHPCKSWDDIKINVMFRALPPEQRTELRVQLSDWTIHQRYWPDDLKKEDFSLRQFERLLHEGADDTLFASAEKHLLEASTSNIILVKENDWVTPNIKGRAYHGLELEGVRKFLESRGQTLKSLEIKMMDLKKYDAMYLVNSVKGLRPVKEVIKKIAFSYPETYLDWESEYHAFRESSSTWPQDS